MADEQSTDPRQAYHVTLTEEMRSEVERLTGQRAESLVIYEDEIREMAGRGSKFQAEYGDSIAAAQGRQ
jgi:hypothetical protein